MDPDIHRIVGWLKHVITHNADTLKLLGLTYRWSTSEYNTIKVADEFGRTWLITVTQEPQETR